jgi:hypothetical protein
VKLCRIICWAKGHRRGRRVAQNDIRISFETRFPYTYSVFECSRCKSQWVRKVKPQPAPVADPPEDDAFTYGRNPRQDEDEDHRLDSPQHGQAKALNRGRG